MKQLNPILVTFISASLLTACNSTPAKFSAQKSYLNQNADPSDLQSEYDQRNQQEQKSSQNISGQLTILPQHKNNSVVQIVGPELALQFSDSELVKMTADQLLIKDYLHYVFGEVLKVSYIVADDLSKRNDTLTLNLQTELSKRRLYTLSEKMLTEKGLAVRYDEGVFYIHEAESAGAGNIVYGYGKNKEDVPLTSSDVVQIAPFSFGMQSQLTLVLKSIANVQATILAPHNAFMLRGKRSEVLKALDFINVVDQPSLKNRSVGLYQSVFVSAQDLAQKLPELLAQEGLSTNLDKGIDKAISMITLEQTGTLVFFAPSTAILERINFWITQIDKPLTGSEMQYFLYKPKYARARDLGESLNLLISGGGNGLSSTTSAEKQNSDVRTQVKSNQTSKSASSEGLKLVVDERANALIFNTSGEQYKKLLPLVKQLDIMPKQVVLEVMIAEVTLTDVFQQGVEFALTNRGASKVGGYKFDADKTGLSYILSGTMGNINLKLLETNSNVNVLSRPTLAVRDGVKASITVGDKIPTVGEIVTDPVNGSRTSIVYLDTGIDLQVTPTINAQGVILMEIAQKISNQANSGASVDGNPTIFERTISTEVIASDGQTIMLGGLISERSNLNDRSVPFFSNIPIIGRLFDGTDNNSSKTELIVLVTPRIIAQRNEWDTVLKQFQATLSELNIQKK